MTTELLSLFLLPFSLLAAIEQLFVNSSQRDRLAVYIFGFAETTFRDFEKNVSVSLISPFTDSSGKISLRRTALLSPFSFFAAAQITLAGLVFYGSEVFPRYEPWTMFQVTNWDQITWVYLTVAILLNLPFDYFSLRVTRWLFTGERASDRPFVVLLVLDIVISCAPLILVVAAMVAIDATGSTRPIFATEYGRHIAAIFGMFFFCSLSAVLVNVLQVGALLVGSALRALLAASRLNQWIGAHTPASSYPLGFIGFVWGILIATIDLLKGL